MQVLSFLFKFFCKWGNSSLFREMFRIISIFSLALHCLKSYISLNLLNISQIFIAESLKLAIYQFRIPPTSINKGYHWLLAKPVYYIIWYGVGCPNKYSLLNEVFLDRVLKQLYPSYKTKGVEPRPRPKGDWNVYSEFQSLNETSGTTTEWPKIWKCFYYFYVQLRAGMIMTQIKNVYPFP